MGCWWVGGRRGRLTGVHPAAVMMRSARRKLRNSDATSRSCIVSVELEKVHMGVSWAGGGLRDSAYHRKQDSCGTI